MVKKYRQLVFKVDKKSLKAYKKLKKKINLID